MACEREERELRDVSAMCLFCHPFLSSASASAAVETGMRIPSGDDVYCAEFVECVCTEEGVEILFCVCAERAVRGGSVGV